MDIVKNYDGKELTIQIKGRIDTVTAPDFENEINDEIGKFDSLILDFTDLEYISSAGLRTLKIIHIKMQKKGGSLTIKNVSDNIMEVFEMTGFAGLLNFV